jgi:hypothetical protein
MLSHMLRAAAGANKKPALVFASNTRISTTSSTQNYGTVAIGDPAPSRVLIITLTGASGTAGRSHTGVTIGGVAATLVVSRTNTSGTCYPISIWYLPYTTGTTANLTSTSTANLGTQRATVYAAYNLVSSTPFSSNGVTSGSGTATSYSTTVNVPADGILFGIAQTGINGPVLTNLTSIYTYLESGDTNIGADLYLPAQTGRTITVTTPSAGRANMGVASWA